MKVKGQNRQVIRRVWRPLLGVLLLTFLLFKLDLNKLYPLALGMDWRWYILALLLTSLNQLTSIRRWQLIANRLGLTLRWGGATDLYLQGLTVNAILPGGIIGGDALRAGALTQQNRHRVGSATNSVMSVLVDRVSGFWGLAILSLLASPWLTAVIATSAPGNAAQFDYYNVGLMIVAVAPLLASFLTNIWIESERLSSLTRLANLMPETLPLSLLVQIFACSSFWACLRATDLDISPAVACALASAIFVAAALPGSVAGFGSREVGSVFLLGALGFSGEAAFTASVLYGLTNTLIALAYLVIPYCWGLIRRSGTRRDANFLSEVKQE